MQRSNSNDDKWDLDDHNGLIIQTRETIYFVDFHHPEDIQPLVSEDFAVKLEVLRGLNDNFYYAMRDNGAASDSLYLLKFEIKDGRLEGTSEVIAAPCTGEILALELDPQITNDVESFYHDNDMLDEWKDKTDQVYVIDGHLNLFKLCLEREVRILNTVQLEKHRNIRDALETMMRGTDFIRVSITERCLSMFGKTYNLHTGFEWDYFMTSEDPEAAEHSKFIRTENLPYSGLQIALITKV